MSKKSAANTGSIRKRTDTRKGVEYTWWEARYTIGRDPGTGKQIQKTITGQSQKEVAQKLKAAVAAIDEGTFVAPNKMKLGDWLDTWAREYLGGVKPKTVVSYEGLIRNHIKPALGALRLDELHPHTVQSFYNSLSEPNGERQALSAKTIKNVHGVLHKAIDQALKNGYIKSNPTDACILPQIEKSEINPLDSNEISLFLQSIRGHKFENVFLFMLFTGVRRGEAIGLTWDCIDFERGTVTIKQQLQPVNGASGDYVLVPTKSSKWRVIAPAGAIMVMLRQQMGTQEVQKAFAPSWEPGNFVFTDDRGKHLSPYTVYHNYKRLLVASGISDHRLHDLRHSYAVAAIRSGDDIKTVQGNLGHATASFTLDVYGHVTDQMRRESADRMDQFIASVSTQPEPEKKPVRVAVRVADKPQKSKVQTKPNK